MLLQKKIMRQRVARAEPKKVILPAGIGVQPAT